MATQNTLAGADINRLLNEEVNPILIEMVNHRSVEKKLLKVKTHPVSGQYFLDKAVTGGNFRLGGRAEGGYIPGFDPGTNLQDKMAKLTTMQSRFKRRFLYTAVDMTGPMRAAPKTATGGFENIASLVLKDTVNNLPEMCSRKWATGQFGILGQVSGNHLVGAAGANEVITLVAANAPTTESAALPWAGNRYFREGMVIDVIGTASDNDAALLTGTGDRFRTIKSVSDDGTTSTITLDDTTGRSQWSSNYRIIEAGGRVAAAISDYEADIYEPMGILDAVQDGSDGVYSVTTYGNNTVSSFKTLQSIKLSAAGGDSGTPVAWSVQLLNRLLEKIRYDANAGDEPDLIYTTPSVYRAGLDSFTTMSNFAGTSSTNIRSGLAAENPIRYMDPGRSPVSVGVTGVVVNNLGSSGSKTIYTSPFAPHFRMYAINRSVLEILQEKEPGFMDDDGLTLRNTSGKDEFTVVWKWYCSGIKSNHPRKCGYITGLKGDHNN